MDKKIKEFLDLLPQAFKGPICKICKEEYAPYDQFICKKCNEAIDRIRK